MSAPIPFIPPRPAGRSQKEQSSSPRDIPSIPPRPARLSNRAPSPSQDTFAPSPLSQTSFPISQDGGFYRNSQNASAASLPKRPSSVNLPSIGQEGSEYESYYEGQQDEGEGSQGTTTPQETRNVGHDVQLHAPKPGLPKSSAKARIATVTRTDSNQAAAAGIGKDHSDDIDPQARPLKAKASFASQESAATTTERPVSAQAGDDEHGIPEIGQRVPMYPNAGDVQAPSPSPFSSTFPAGIGFHNDGRHHRRQRSGKEHLPPGSYGLHGHGTPAQDRFEKAWYEKHPDALEREEHGEYGPGIGGGRGEFALSSDDLNKIVRDTASRGAGFGTSPAVASTPNEQIGFLASEEYASRLTMSRSPSSSGIHQKAQSNHSQSHVVSPLRKASIPADGDGSNDLKSLTSDTALKRTRSENAVESEAEEDVIHIEAPARPFSKITGGGYDTPTEDLGPQGGNTEEEGGFLDERGYGTPILASDEIAKEPGAEFLQPAIEPHQERRGNDFYAGLDSENPASYVSGHGRNGSRGSSIAGSRPTSRAGGTASALSGLSRFTTRDEEVGTPLEDVEEYEPLFPEDDKEGAARSVKVPPPSTAAERLKRHGISKHKFPSQDIWEDAPSSAQQYASVSTPDLPATTTTEIGKPLPVTEPTHADEFKRHQAVSNEPDSHSFLAEEAKPQFGAHLRDDVPARPGKQRFPSRDIWEDSPSSHQLETVVATPQTQDGPSPPVVPGRPSRAVATKAQDRSGSDETIVGAEAGAAAGVAAGLATSAAAKPGVPARPSKAGDGQRSEETSPHPIVPVRPSDRAPFRESSPRSSPTDRKAPSLPDRPKPQVPARPAKLVGRESSENIPLTKTISGSSARSIDSNKSLDGSAAPSPPKPKPAVPLRPSGGKIASLKAGFMSDLDKRLKLGPQGPKPADKSPEEEDQSLEKEAVPLSDARKGRARGPARRKPAASPSGAEPSSTPASTTAHLGLVAPSLVWQISDDGAVRVSSTSPTSTRVSASSTKAAEAATPTLATNTAGEPVHSVEEASLPAENKVVSPNFIEEKAKTHEVKAAAAASPSSAKQTLTEPAPQENSAEAADVAASGHTSHEPAVPVTTATGGGGDENRDVEADV